MDSDGHEHQNVQVIVAVEGDPEQAVLQLVGAEGALFRAVLPGAEEHRGSDAEGETSEGDEAHDLAASLEQAREEN